MNIHEEQMSRSDSKRDNNSIERQEVMEDNTGLADRKEAACSCKKKYRDKNESEYKDLITRLNRIEGQVRGIRNMVEENRYCVDILTQVSAISSALNAFNKVLLGEHIKSCVVEDIRNGQEDAVDELCALLQKLMK